MSYATREDLDQWIDHDLLVRLTDDNDAGFVNDRIVDAVLEAASLEIDGYLGGRYTLPLNPPPPIMKKLCVDITGYLLHLRREEAPGEYWERQYNNAIAFLGKIAEGRITLGAADPDGSGEGHKPQISGPGRVFSRDTMKGY